MPASAITATRTLSASAVSSANTIAELLELVPAPYRPRTAMVVNEVYGVAVKSNNVRTYIAALEKHKADNTFPSEIGNRVLSPAVQFSKEYMATAAYRTGVEKLNAATREHSKTMLASAIELKNMELTHLQTLFSQASYKERMEYILQEVTLDLAHDAGLDPDRKAKIDGDKLPEWVKGDYHIFKSQMHLYPQRAIALAYMVIARQTASKLKSLSLKGNADADVQMMDASDRQETVEATVEKTIARLIKENKITSIGKKSASAAPRPKKVSKPSKPPRNAKASTNTQGGKGKGSGKKKFQRK